MHQANTPHKPRILILDEDRIILQSLSQFLSREGYDVRTCDVPEDVFSLMDNGQIEVLLADINMPGVRAAEFLRDVRRRAPQVVTIVITGYGSIEGAVEATKMGAFDYLTKPIVDDEIRVIVEKAVRQQSLMYENQTLRQQLDMRFGFENIVGHDYKMLKIFDLAEAVADARTTVLMTGESGTGKSLLARAIHHRSPRRDKPFVEVSCGAPPETLLESELFGHTKGAFTGAIADKPGRFLTADGGTLFLDEINSASPAMQVKLLRMLQEHRLSRWGAARRGMWMCVILASNVDLTALVAEQKFRQDLYYRINVVTIRLPSLRERLGDIPLLSGNFLRQFCKESGREVLGFSESAMAALQRYDWPGNVRELENAIERAVVLCRRPQIDIEDLPEVLQPVSMPKMAAIAMAADVPDSPMPLETVLQGPERRIIEAALKRNEWNRQATASELNINRTTLYKKMRKYQLDLGV